MMWIDSKQQVVNRFYQLVRKAAVEFFATPSPFAETSKRFGLGYCLVNPFALATVLCWLTTAACFSDQPKRLPIWSGQAPLTVGDDEKDAPVLLRFVPETELATDTAIVIFPGGGYGHLAMDHEGRQIANWLNENGIHAFVCDYRHRGKGYGHPAPMLDAKRAVRFVRANAAAFAIDPDKIGVFGFSAGGHLASTVATHFDGGKTDSKDNVEQQSCRPDFAILCYPVIAMGEPFSHKGSQRNLLGKDPASETLRELSNHTHVDAQTPPTFLWHTSEDKAVTVEHSLVFYQALVAAGVPAELHVYERGRHGLGLAEGIVGTEEWPHACLSWLQGRNLISK